MYSIKSTIRICPVVQYHICQRDVHLLLTFIALGWKSHYVSVQTWPQERLLAADFIQLTPECMVCNSCNNWVRNCHSMITLDSRHRHPGSTFKSASIHWYDGFLLTCHDQPSYAKAQLQTPHLTCLLVQHHWLASIWAQMGQTQMIKLNWQASHSESSMDMVDVKGSQQPRCPSPTCDWGCNHSWLGEGLNVVDTEAHEDTAAFMSNSCALKILTNGSSTVPSKKHRL